MFKQIDNNYFKKAVLGVQLIIFRNQWYYWNFNHHN